MTLLTNTAFCALCSHLTIAALYPPNVYHHAANLAAVEQSGKTCQLCKLIHWCLHTNTEYESTPHLKFEGADQEIVPYGNDALEERNQCSIKLQIIPKQPNDGVRPGGFTHVGLWMKSKYMISDLTLSVEEGDALGTSALTIDGQDCFIAGRILVSEHPPEAHFDVARQWLHTCQANHVACADHSDDLPQLPTRVLHVGKHGESPRLVDGAGRYARYATLSHCWGHAPTIKTEMETLRLRQDQIPLNTLPKTFREAILTCRELNIPYLWIDSLCIIQDSKDDWEYHSSIMGSIFYESTITIAATDAPNSSRGLFIPATSYNEHPWLGIIALAPRFGNDHGKVYVSAPSWHVFSLSVSTGILQSRGWVMQEKYLSRRTLHFLNGQMVWECSEVELDQCGYVEANLGDNLRLNLRTPLKAFSRAFDASYRCSWLDEDEEKDGACATTIIDLRASAQQDQAPPIQLNLGADRALYRFIDEAINSTIYHVWYHSVSVYSDRRLTFEFDKLPALAGIASRIYDITKDEYLAGHWRRELERSLFWRLEIADNNGPPSRVKQYRAPSWSWASVNARTNFEFAGTKYKQDVRTKIEILDAIVDVDGTNPFGCVTGGKIVMEASLMRASWQTIHGSWVMNGSATTSYGPTLLGDLIFTNDDNTVVGVWSYDDMVHGVMPGSLLEECTSVDEVMARSVWYEYFGSTINVHAPDANDNSTLWKSATYLPENLVLVRGPTRSFIYNSPGWREGTAVDVLILTMVESSDDQYRRVGIGFLTDWDESQESVEILTVV